MKLWEPLSEAVSTQVIRFFEAEIPFNVLLGMRVVRLGRGACELMIPARPELTGDPGRPALHGGVVSTLADASGGLAVFVHQDATPLPRVSTVDLRLDYLRPGRVDQDLHAISEIRRVGNRVAAVATVLFHDDPTQPIAEARAVYNLVRSS
jgi:uncharacterized protein (TIGR00369 family)